MSTPEPGLDRHEWESEMEALAPELEDSPAEALPELDTLVERMLVERGFPVDDAVADDGVEPEILTEFRAARDTLRMLERGDGVGPGDVAAAVNGYRAVYDYLIAERSAP
ncbi:MAG TPA: hypothetical protein VE444_05390 [Gaiellaceae bacterium]|jgi:hypothetical protein|nr:hypothetical protein [Gaiellaceae bacterium]